MDLHETRPVGIGPQTAAADVRHLSHELSGPFEIR